jgi:acyl dehydratase
MDPADLQPGHELPPFTRASGLATWNRFAAVNDEFVDIHMDDEAGRASGYAGAFAMGDLHSAYLHNVLRAWLPPDGRIVTVACRFRDAGLRGETLTARGRIESVEVAEEDLVVELSVWTEAPGGRRLAIGHATVAIPS